MGCQNYLFLRPLSRDVMNEGSGVSTGAVKIAKDVDFPLNMFATDH